MKPEILKTLHFFNRIQICCKNKLDDIAFCKEIKIISGHTLIGASIITLKAKKQNYR